MVGGAVHPLNDHTSKICFNLDQWFQMIFGQSLPNLHIFIKYRKADIFSAVTL